MNYPQHEATETSRVQLDILAKEILQPIRVFDTGIASIARHLPEGEEILVSATVVSTSDFADIEALAEGQVKHLVNSKRLNDARYANKYLEAVNSKLPIGGYLVGCAETAAQRRHRILAKSPRWLAHPALFVDFVYKRVLPKLSTTKRLYFAITKGQNRVLSRAEILGRIAACGFEIVQQREFQGKLFFAVRKSGEPAYDSSPSYGPIFRMRRVGQGGQGTYVYKFRTMHPYAEYLQEHMYLTNRLDAGGKIKDDFRVTSWGKFMRRFWIDELPMLFNLLKGDMKIVGVRPISEHYLSLYPEDIKALRLEHKPGLIPPFYVDLPSTFEEILASEKRYMLAYEKDTWRADVRYFCSAVYNIVVKRARSQ